MQIDGQPVLKRSEDKIKLINPGFQITWRISAQDKEKGNSVDGYVFKADVTCLRGDATDLAIQQGKTVTIRDEFDSFKTKTFEEGTYDARPLQLQSIKAGKRIAPYYDLQMKKAFYRDNLHHFFRCPVRPQDVHHWKAGEGNRLL